MSEYSGFNGGEHAMGDHGSAGFAKQMHGGACTESSHHHSHHESLTATMGDTHFEPHAYNTFSGTGQGLSYADAIVLPDPLSQSHCFHMQPIDWNHVHIVKPHYVHTYVKSDGTVVEGHLRGEGEGYLRTNPDGDQTNNLNV